MAQKLSKNYVLLRLLFKGGYYQRAASNSGFTVIANDYLGFFSAQCESHVIALIGDSICDDVANTEVCSFDGGDCCHKNSDFGACSNCTCYVNIIEIEVETKINEIENDASSEDMKKNFAMRSPTLKMMTLISTLLFVTLRKIQ